jgi:hypothetical protein
MDVVVFAQRMYKVLRQRQEDISDAIISDAPKDWEAYKKLVGELRGLAFAEDQIKALLEKNADYDEDTFSS